MSSVNRFVRFILDTFVFGFEAAGRAQCGTAYEPKHLSKRRRDGIRNKSLTDRALLIQGETVKFGSTSFSPDDRREREFEF